MVRRVVIPAVVLLLVGGAVFLAWTALGLPPVRYYLRFGLSPWCAPTGETKEVGGHVFVEISPGIFRMGSTHGSGGDALGRICARLGLPWGDQPEATNEIPVHFVEFREGYWIAKHEVTNAQYERFDPQHERTEYSPGDDHPVVEVSWEDARNYCAGLSEESGLPVRLPSEAEWECACRGGSRTEFSFGDDEERLATYAWYGPNASGGTRPVGGRRPNAWGLYDLHGNVWEWCEDTWHESFEGAPSDGSAWTEGGEEWGGASSRVCRGGCWISNARRCRSADRGGSAPDLRFYSLGFRPCLSPLDD